MREGIFLVLWVIAVLICPGISHAGTVAANGTGEAAVVGITPEEGRLIALQRARADAIEKAAGINILGTTVVTQGKLVGQFLKTYSTGFITQEKVKWGWSFMPDGTPKYTADISATVMLPEKKTDPDFSLEGDLNKPSFLSGENAVFTMRVSKKARIAIFNFRADDTVVMVYPYEKEAVLEPKKSFRLPEKGSRDVFEMTTFKDHKRDSEAFFIVALRVEEGDRFRFTSLFSSSRQYSIPEFFSIYGRIADRTVEVIRPYEVRKKES